MKEYIRWKLYLNKVTLSGINRPEKKMASPDSTPPSLILFRGYYQRKREMLRSHTPSSMTILKCILDMLGLKISYQKNKLRNNIVWFCNKIAILVIIILIFLMFVKVFNLQHFSKRMKKIVISSSIMESNFILFWCTILYSGKNISKICKRIERLKKTFKITLSGHFSILLIIFLFLSYTSVVVADMYDKDNEEFLSELYFSKFINKNARRGLALALTFIYHSYLTLLPHTFITLYIILCHDIYTILLLYIKRNNVINSQNKECITQWFDFYSSALHTFQSFESTFSLSIFIVFSQSLGCILSNIFLIIENGPFFSGVCTSMINMILITLIILVASKVYETDGMVKRINLQNLENLLQIDKQFQTVKALRIWRLNNSPAFTLTAWGFFSLKKGLYLNVINVMITYTLLVLNL